MTLETKIIISYLLICVTYISCRLHYLLTQKTNKDFNAMIEELVDLAGNEDIVKTYIVVQIMFSPIIAPLSIIKQIYKLVKELFVK